MKPQSLKQIRATTRLKQSRPKAQIEPLYVRLGETLYEVRLRRKLSAGKVASSVGLSAPTLSRIENGLVRVQLHQLLKLAAVLHIRMADLLGEED